jgi:hypothetical protein
LFIDGHIEPALFVTPNRLALAMTSSVETVWPAKEARLAEVRRVPEHGHDDIVFPCASIYVDFLAARSKARDGALLLCRSRICSNLSPSHTWPGYQGFPAQVLLKAAMGRLSFFFASISMSKVKSSGMRGSNVSQLKSKVCTCVTPAASAAYTMTRCAAATAVSTIR